MDIRYIAWGGYDFDYTAEGVGVCAPEVASQDIGEKRMKGQVATKKVNIRGDDLKPSLVAFPGPTIHT